MRTLLHACCGPCSLEPVRIYKEEEADFGIFYSNSNIYPEAEYEQRLDTINDYVIGPNQIPFYEDEYIAEEWEEKAAIYGTDREKRCRACYRLRFEHLARAAKKLGYDAIGSTLTISPYQFTQAIIEELDRAAKTYGLESDARDFSDCYQEATRRSRELGMYRQNYCGCRFSIAEAELERRERAEAREKQKLIKQLALLEAAAEGAVNQVSQL